MDFTTTENESEGDSDDVFELYLYTDANYTELVGDDGIVLGDTVYAELTSSVIPSSVNWYVNYCKVSFSKLTWKYQDFRLQVTQT